MQTGDIRHAETFTNEYTQTYSEDGLAQSRMWPIGTLCITIAANIAETAILGIEACFPDSVVGLLACEGVSVRYIELFIRTARDRLEAYAPATAQKNINLGVLNSVAIPIPPSVEQEKIVDVIDENFSITSFAEETVERSVVRSERLRQSILSKAFKGELVAQNMNDEPASVLLDRLGVHEKKSESQKSKPKKPPKKQVFENEMNNELPDLTAFFPRSRKAIRLIRVHVPTSFRSLSNVDATLRGPQPPELKELSPICFVGLNGSGKSNLAEFLGAILCDVELSLLGFQSAKTPAKLFNLPFNLEYELFAKDAPSCRVEIEKTKDGKLPVFTLKLDGETFNVSDSHIKLNLLPSQVIAYSSGLNETVSIPFLRSQAHYASELLLETQGRLKDEEGVEHDAERIRSVFLDYELNAAILITNYVFASKKDLGLFRKRLRIKALKSFSITYRLKRPGSTSPVRLTESLEANLALFRQCATSVEENEKAGETFHFEFNDETRENLQRYFVSSTRFYSTLHRWTMLNAVAQSSDDREYFLRSNPSTDMLSRPPNVAQEDKIFSIDNVILELSAPKTSISYTGLSDGEHQYMQVIGSVLLFSDPGCVFLFDEPETHFNPRWRRHFVDDINSFSSTKCHDMIVSTHSPFVVSGCQNEGVFKFTRNGGSVSMRPVEIETFGTSFELLLSELFELESLVSEHAIDKLKQILDTNNEATIRAAIEEFGESVEKRFIYQKLAEMAEGKR